MLEYAPMLHVSYAQNYAGIIRQGLSCTHVAWEWLIITEATGMASMQTMTEIIASTRCSVLVTRF